jgi:hypothetical protein
VLLVWPRLSRFDLGAVRILGPGLGNLLFPWARAIELAETLGVSALWPTWPQIKLGPVLRCERDARFYADLFRPTPQYVDGPLKLAALLAFPRVAEDRAPIAHRGLVVVEGMAGQFRSLEGPRSRVVQKLREITRLEHLPPPRVAGRRVCAVHVRLGDFSEPRDLAELRRGGQGYRIPMRWYVDVVAGLAAADPALEFLIYSDGSDRELAPLLATPQVRRASAARSALADLWMIAEADVLVGSASTFSLWAAYLGGMPSVWFKGELSSQLHRELPGKQLDLDLGEAVPSWFTASCRRAAG